MVYPRVCGGTPIAHQTASFFRGLSPRVRGNLSTEPRARSSIRSIPACAGEPAGRGAGAPAAPVYPRVCGGTGGGPFPLPRGLGLSPRVRGNPGTTKSAGAYLWRLPEVYPRVCGGTWDYHTRIHRAYGLSPRVRGNRQNRKDSQAVKRSIPACAGEPEEDWKVIDAAAVYPRVCGGTAVGNGQVPFRFGLSPRVRGNRRRSIATSSSPRSIPACAGEPRCPGGWCRCGQVYPRVCGGTDLITRRMAQANGLSPRVRGNLQRLDKRHPVSGSIPACAGEPNIKGLCWAS